MPNTNNETAFVEPSEQVYGKKINPIVSPERNIGIDTNNEFYGNILDAAEIGKFDLSKIESFTQVSQNREQLYQLIDTMSEDPIVAAVLETYAEDATETNDEGRIIWCESDSPEVGKYVTYLLDTMNVDKNAFKWTHSLIKYGDVYLRLFRQSDLEDDLFSDDIETRKRDNKLNESLAQVLDRDIEDEKYDNDANSTLNEDVKFRVYKQNDNYTHYVELHPNPSEMFELTKFGKSYAYLQAETNTAVKNNDYQTPFFRYSFKKKDVNVFGATDFVHASLEDNTSRLPEEVDILMGDTEDVKLSYTVRRGQSLLYSSFKIWRELMLLENALLLNRITKSSIIRVIGVEVGDMPKENVGPHLQGIKQLIEQKSSINEGNYMSEYTNPGPMENNIYVPTHNGIGALSTEQVGGDVDVGGLGDIDYFKNKFYGSLRVPKQYFGDTDDGAGFNGGTSLSIISSRYAKAVVRIQNTLIQAITDAINLMLLDKGLNSYVGKFSLHMVKPSTQEELDRRDNLSGKVQITSDIMNLLSDIQDDKIRMEILKSLLSDIVSNADVMQLVQDYIDSLEDEGGEEEFEEDSMDEFSPGGVGGMGGSSSFGDFGDFDTAEEPAIPQDDEFDMDTESDNELPTPDSLGVDMTDNNLEI